MHIIMVLNNKLEIGGKSFAAGESFTVLTADTDEYTMSPRLSDGTPDLDTVVSISIARMIHLTKNDFVSFKKSE